MKFGLIGNTEKEESFSAAIRLLELERQLDVEFLLHDTFAKQLMKRFPDTEIPKKNILAPEKLIQRSDIMIAMGGDGTILTAARMVGRSAVPILGINLGKLGFLAELSVEDMESCIGDILRDQHVVEERTVAKVSIDGSDDEMFALNDIVIDKSSSSRIINIAAYVNNEYLIGFPGDGLIVATPTGSTGYALAAGGPIIVPTTDVFVLQPISPHMLTARPVIIPDSSVVRVDVARADELRVTADGQQEIILKSPARMLIQKADYTVKLIKRKDKSYYDVLRTKLMWGKDIRLRTE